MLQAPVSHATARGGSQRCTACGQRSVRALAGKLGHNLCSYGVPPSCNHWGPCTIGAVAKAMQIKACRMKLLSCLHPYNLRRHISCICSQVAACHMGHNHQMCNLSAHASPFHAVQAAKNCCVVSSFSSLPLVQATTPGRSSERPSATGKLLKLPGRRKRGGQPKSASRSSGQSRLLHGASTWQRAPLLPSQTSMLLPAPFRLSQGSCQKLRSAPIDPQADQLAQQSLAHPHSRCPALSQRMEQHLLQPKRALQSHQCLRQEPLQQAPLQCKLWKAHMRRPRPPAMCSQAARSSSRPTHSASGARLNPQSQSCPQTAARRQLLSPSSSSSSLPWI